jgi:peptide/nickel transport system permease protein
MVGLRRYVIRRLIASVPVILGATLIVFSILHLTKGDPVSLMVSHRATEERKEELRHQLGLDRPIYVQYARWIYGVMRGDLGDSIVAKRPVLDLILNRLPFTLRLTVTALLLSTIAGIPIGVLSAVKQYSFLDYSSMSVALVGLSMPGFWLGLMLMLLFGLKLGWVPISGHIGIKSLILPSLTLALPETAMIARLIRSEMLEVIHDDYILTARAKGLRETIVIYKHALRNAIIPVVVYLFLGIPWLVSGAVVIETVFAWPGMGQLMYRSIVAKDFPIVQGIVFIIALLTVLCNLLGDVLTGLLDPRIRLG